MSDIDVTIEAVPDSVLLPNARAHRLRRNDAAQAMRAIARATVANAVDRKQDAARPWSLTVDVRWPRGRRVPDLDNTIASLKSAIDGIADAIGVDDRHMTALTVSQRRAHDGRAAMAVRISFHQTVK